MFIRDVSHSPEDFNIGDFVKVEADRGHDLGVISEIHIAGYSPAYPYQEIPFRRVISLATPEEKAYHMSKLDEEFRALDICRDLAARRMMKINVLDAEFQFDRRKLTFLFTSEK
jgi:cell fate regulator YaaT (PSP1 superfamily)